MGVDAASFRRALGQFASGVTVVTTRDAAGHPLGLTVSAFCSVSLHPPLVLVCLDHRSEANAGMRESGLFAVSGFRTQVLALVLFELFVAGRIALRLGLLASQLELQERTRR